ncbi:DUF58 domain-containing protein [Ostreibacterium oceani]|uniref:DUF58 domain-containing protein n=1 Tax=Ostreibacterium oceani TaxID=2654998 RepID=A0A6N7EWQ0_9GAMM|nr:DUF58 domain-containing protein [Ostreibacterium oceani]MPV86942.1 DUF58 domain-containing protein [Ostreibacterium oceani]
MMRLIPSKKQLILLGAVIAATTMLSILRLYYPVFGWGILLLLVMTGVLLVYDASALYRRIQPIQILASRKMPRHVAVGIPTPVHLILKNLTDAPIDLLVFDHLPETFGIACESKVMPFAVQIAANSYADYRYEVIANQRGPALFSQTQCRMHSPWALWSVDFSVDNETAVKTYPDFRKIDQNDILSENENSTGQLTKQRKRGTGTEFSQLREYRMDDSLKQIDYKATARLNKLISKEYEIERDQQVLILLDCSRRLRAGQGRLSHFDHALNATIFLARTILKQGDAVGLMSFSGDVERYVKPRKGRNSVNQLLNQVYDLDSSRYAPDYVKAAENVLLRQKRRSLVIVVTSLNDEDIDAVKMMIKTLQKRHIVLIANIKEPLLDADLRVNNLDEAVFFAARETYQHYRQQMFAKIKNNRLILLDTYPDALNAKLINLYLNIKQSGIF